MEKKADIGILLGGVTFQNPVFVASGICGYGEEYAPVLALEKLGAIVTKTITLEPRSGNPQPRIHELSTGLLNSIGLENVGLDAYLKEKLPLLREKKISVITSIAGDRLEDFASIAERLALVEGYKGVEVNLSCPNVERGFFDHGRDPETVEKIASTVKKALPHRVLLVKLTPNVSRIGEVAAAAESGGADAITAINTLFGADFDLGAGKPVFPKVRAGYSGPGILPVALEKVWEVASEVAIPVVGVGGISSVEDARKFFLAGAKAVQVGTALFSDPGLPERMVAAFETHPEWLSGLE